MAAPGTPTPDPSASAAPLRERLIGVTLDLVATEGIESLTLRRIARRAGVSHGAPLRHFASLADLRSEVAAEGFRRLRASIDAAAESLPSGTDALSRLRAAGRGYVRAAVADPGLFTLMFQPDRLDATNAHFVADSRDAFELLLRHVRAAQDAGWRSGRDTRLLAGVVWSGVHGLASLWSQGAFQGPNPDVSLDDALELGVELLLDR